MRNFIALRVFIDSGQAGEKAAYQHPERLTDIVGSAGPDPVCAPCVFLNLLIADVHSPCHFFLAKPLQGTIFADAGADEGVDPIRPRPRVMGHDPNFPIFLNFSL
ncbi:MAG: hypothetical protein VX741_03175 [Pseudomonadota bacterium]|nr:hypothetical protein [Pseudomonadota bacterium]